MLIILTLYLVLALLIFAKLKIIKLGWISEAITAPIEASILWEPSLLPLGDWVVCMSAPPESPPVATAWIRQKLLNLCELVQVSRSLSIEEMREFVRTLFSLVSSPAMVSEGSHVECSGLSR